ncbi:MAG TPA: hypothetical protein VMT34_06425 [Aggregatilineales bacterium]|nr:hypothetical protein [Aggregatilineales bacterium]
MFQKKDVQWWISEVQQHPESAVDVVRTLGDRIAFLDRQNEELRAELIALKRSTRGGDVESLKRRIVELENALRGGTERRVVIYGRDRITFNATLSVAEQAGTSAPVSAGVCLLVCAPSAKLIAVGDDGRLYGMEYDALPLATDFPVMLGQPDNIAVILDAAIFERFRYLTVITRQGMIYSELGGAVTASARKGDKIIRGLRPGDTITNAVPSSNGDLFAISRKGRWIRFSEKVLTSAGAPVMKLPTDDSVFGVVPLSAEADLTFIAADGRAFVRSSARDFTARKAPGSPGGVLFRNITLVGAGVSDEIALLTERGRLLRIMVRELPFRAQTESGFLLPGIEPGDSVIAVAAI